MRSLSRYYPVVRLMIVTRACAMHAVIAPAMAMSLTMAMAMVMALALEMAISQIYQVLNSPKKLTLDTKKALFIPKSDRLSPKKIMHPEIVINIPKSNHLLPKAALFNVFFIWQLPGLYVFGNGFGKNECCKSQLDLITIPCCQFCHTLHFFPTAAQSPIDY